MNEPKQSKTHAALDDLKAQLGEGWKIVADDIIDVLEEVLSDKGLIGSLGQAVINDVRDILGIPDDIGGDRD